MRFEYVAQAVLVLIGVIHSVPGIVACAPGRAVAVYGTGLGNHDQELLLRHRALLLAAVGIGLVVGAFAAPIRVAAFVAAAISMTSFVALAFTVGFRELNGKAKRVAWVDVVALIALAFSALAFI
ncbi:hypothetical protein ACFYO1_43335 [Nocardia sp. NPDC006044]|uniref:hypothetical protein n=1 Tax=Nocardia sp. NPDC006044 TaxID=3364306 RepID=UPI0036B917BD